MNKIHARLKAEQQRQGMPVRELARRSTYCPSHISNVLNNNRRVSLECLVHLSRALEKPVSFFLGET